MYGRMDTGDKRRYDLVIFFDIEYTYKRLLLFQLSIPGCSCVLSPKDDRFTDPLSGTLDKL